MKINGIDISKYNAKQWKVDMSYASVSNGSDWQDGKISPVMMKGSVGFKKIKVSLKLSGNSREEIWENGSNLVASLLSPSEIKLDGFSHLFFMYLKNVEQVEQSIKRWHKATLELYGYEYGDETSIQTTQKKFVVTNEGNLVTPAIIEITPSIGKVDLTVTGLVRDSISGDNKSILINNLTSGKTIKIDGESGLITEMGVNKFKDVELYDLPNLIPGENEITIDKDDVTIKITYKPRFM